MKNQKRSNKALRPNAHVVKAAPTQDSFQNFQARIGYNTGNLSDSGSYSVDFLSRDRQKLEAMYRSSWICGKAVDAVAEDMTKRGIEINSEAQPGEIDDLLAEWKRLKVWDKLCDTIKWARLYGGAIAVMLIDGQAFNTPLRIKTIAKDQFKGLLVLDRWMITPSVSDPINELGPEMGLPKFYELNVLQNGVKLSQSKIHHSRVIRIEGADLPYQQRITENGWGQSVLERLFDRLLAFDSTTQGTAQLVYKAHLRTYKVKSLREIIAAGGKALEALIKQIDFIRLTQTNEGMTLMDAEDEFEAHQYSFAGLDTVLLSFAQQISGSLGMPLTRLFGQSPAGLNSTGESDTRNYYDSIEQEQERRLRSGLDTLVQVSFRSKHGKDAPEGTSLTFRPLWQLSDTEKGAVTTSTTGAVTAAVSSSVIGRKTALKELKQLSHVTGVFSNITDEMIEAADDDVDSGEFMPGDPFGNANGNDEDAEGGETKPAEKKPLPKAA